MQKFVSTKQLYENWKQIGDEVQNGTTFIVLKYSQPVYKITPLDKDFFKDKKYNLTDFSKFIFTSKNKKESNLDTNYKKYLYS
jgi:hypothetical protein